MLEELLRIVGGDDQRGLLASEQGVPKGRGVCLSLEVWLRLIYNIPPNAWNVPGCSMTFCHIP